MKGKGGLSSSAGHLAVDITELVSTKADVTKSPGFGREKHMDKQRKKEKQQVEEKEREESHKSSFSQCTFNMANILMVSYLSISCAHYFLWYELL